MSGRKIVDEKDARTSLEAAARSGLSTRDWARQEGIDGRSLRAWATNLARRAEGTPKRPRRRGGASTLQRLVELVPAAAATASPFVVRLGAFALEVGPGFVEADLRRLLGVLRAC